MGKNNDKKKYMKKYFELFDSNDQDFDKVIDAHDFCCDRETIQKSQKCGCFECYAIIDAKKILDEYDQGELMVCPCCRFDTLIGDACGFPVTDKKFLDKMQQFWMSAE